MEPLKSFMSKLIKQNFEDDKDNIVEKVSAYLVNQQGIIDQLEQDKSDMMDEWKGRLEIIKNVEREFYRRGKECKKLRKEYDKLLIENEKLKKRNKFLEDWKNIRYGKLKKKIRSLAKFRKGA